MDLTTLTIVAVLLILWVSILTVFVLRMIHHYNQLGASVDKAGLKDVLSTILSTQQGLVSKAKKQEALLAATIADGTGHFQKVGIVRFNPFADTGGSQSFTVALLDKQDTGVVMTSLYARAGNRWYIKEVVAGKGKEYTLSREEESAIKKAQKI